MQKSRPLKGRRPAKVRPPLMHREVRQAGVSAIELQLPSPGFAVDASVLIDDISVDQCHENLAPDALPGKWRPAAEAQQAALCGLCNILY